MYYLLMLIDQAALIIDILHQNIVPMSLRISLLGEVKNNWWFPKVVLKSN